MKLASVRMNYGSESRRSFIRKLGSVAPALAFVPGSMGIQALAAGSATKELKADIAIIGGGLGGVAAALAAVRAQASVILTEETDWPGGQLTSQAVPPDENPWIESFGGTRSYLALRQTIRSYYLRNFPVTAEARLKPDLNPGNGGVSRLCCEPRVALASIFELLAPHIASGKLILLLRHKPHAANVAGDRVETVQLRNLETGASIVVHAPVFLDATETGELLPLTGTEYVTGAESRKTTGEPHAPEAAVPSNMQAFTCCFAMDYLDGEDHTIEKPAEYTFWRDFVPKLNPPWPGKLLSWEYCDPITLKPKRVDTDPKQGSGLFAYRRIIDRTQFAPGTYAGDMSLVNWPQNDYLLGNPFEVPETESVKHIDRAKQLSLSLLYWMQTEAPRPDGGTGWKGLRLRPDVVGTDDGLAKMPYIRESRRIKAVFTVLEQHVSTEARKAELGQKSELRATEFSDSVGIGSYRIDLHPSTGGDNYIDISSLPFQIPLGALLPQRVTNLLPACKNLGVTHISNGCYRLHPVEWNIGESAGLLAAFSLKQKCLPRSVREKPDLLRAFQTLLAGAGVPLNWPKVTPR